MGGLGSGTVRNAQKFCQRNRTDGQRCGNYALVGLEYCRFHGSANGVTRRKGQQTAAIVEAACSFHGTQKWLAEELRPRALARLMEIVEDPEASQADIIRITQMVLDRTGHSPGVSINVDVNASSPLEQITDQLDRIAGRVVEVEATASRVEVLDRAAQVDAKLFPPANVVDFDAEVRRLAARAIASLGDNPTDAEILAAAKHAVDAD